MTLDSVANFVKLTVSGSYGESDTAITAVDISLWSLEHGYVAQWSCARILKII